MIINITAKPNDTVAHPRKLESSEMLYIYTGL